MRSLLVACLALLAAPPAHAAPAAGTAPTPAPQPLRLRALDLSAPRVAPWLLAQRDSAVDDEEPTEPGQQKAAKTRAGAAKPDADEPAQPGAPKGDPAAEPGHKPDEPKPVEQPVVKKSGAMHGLGLQLRAIFVHEWFLNAFLDASTPLNSAALGAEFIRRKDDLDIIGSIDFGFYGPEDGNYLGNGKNAAIDTDYVQFRSFNILSFNAHFIWHVPILRWMSFIYGVGIGLGIVLGDMYRISNDPARCNRENAADENACYPRGVDPRTREEDLKRLAGGVDDPNNPHLFKEEDVPPVVPMVHALLGFSFKITDEISIRVDGGFRNAFYIGAASHWFFF